MNYMIKVIIALLVICLFAACSDDKEPNITGPEVTDTTGNDSTKTDTTKSTLMNSIIVKNQLISQYKIKVEKVTFEKDGWLIVRPDSAGIPDESTIISEPLFVTAGTTENLGIQLTNYASNHDGKVEVWIILHTDDGNKGAFEFDGISGIDPHITDQEGKIIKKVITLTPPFITAKSQDIKSSVEVTVQTAVDSWLVAYKTPDGHERNSVIGKTKVAAGFNGKVVFNVDVYLEDYEKYILVVMHIDEGIKDKFEYPGPDSIEYYGNFEHNGSKLLVKRLVWDEK